MARSPARSRWHAESGAPVLIAAKATIVATGGLTRLYRRNSASANMGGDGYALALRAGAPLIDMEFVQFFPIGHLAPRLIGMDPIMWDPFRYKLGGRLLNARRGVHRTLRRAGGRQVRRHPRRRHLRDHQGGRGRPRLAARRRLSELPACAGGQVARGVRPGDRPAGGERHRPHQNAGRGRADRALPHGRRRGRRGMETEVPGLLVAGEAVGGANGANRLSGNAITEALVFGRQAGRSAAARAKASRPRRTGGSARHRRSDPQRRRRRTPRTPPR